MIKIVIPAFLGFASLADEKVIYLRNLEKAFLCARHEAPEFPFSILKDLNSRKLIAYHKTLNYLLLVGFNVVDEKGATPSENNVVPFCLSLEQPVRE
ncbi:hypothetical protein [Photorhabdus aegyptia]|uniref:hypothetical protein n=1 Tax=Photorhabdus aegyptia TaxID=2805098 RepID=UPI00055D4C72|nr:hypothetical protein [Photorhabdus aegyptia]